MSGSYSRIITITGDITLSLLTRLIRNINLKFINEHRARQQAYTAARPVRTLATDSRREYIIWPNQ